MEFVRGHEEDFERLPALCINLSAERVGIEYQDENLSSCELEFRNLSSHLVVRLSRTKDSSFYFGVESVRVPDPAGNQTRLLRDGSRIVASSSLDRPQLDPAPTLNRSWIVPKWILDRRQIDLDRP